MFFFIYTHVKNIRPKINGWIFKILFSGNRIKIGKNFQCDTWPTITIDKNAKLIIEDNILLRRNVEIRSHGNSLIHLKGNNRIDRGVRFLSANKGKIVLNKGVRVGLYSVFNGGDDIIIGKKALISGFVYLQTSMHNHKKGGIVQDQGYTHGTVILEDDVWLGTHVVVLPNCVVKKGSIVGSNSVVTKTVEKEKIVVGIPAKILKDR